MTLQVGCEGPSNLARVPTSFIAIQIADAPVEQKCICLSRHERPSLTAWGEN